MSVAIGVVNYGSSALLEENLVSSQRDAAEHGEDVVVVVVDNYSSDQERVRLRALAAANDWILVEGADNPGFGDGANAALTKGFDVGASEVLLLNPDARIDAVSLQRLRDSVAADRLTITAPTILDGRGRVWFSGSYLHLEDGETRSSSTRSSHHSGQVAPWLTGACLLITREVFDRLGGFSSDYFLYWEDVDLSWRAIESGVTLRVLDDARAVHDAGGTQRRTAERGKSRTYYFYNARNRLLFAARNLDESQMRDWLRATRRATWSILMRGGRRQLLHDPGLAWAALRGALEGRRIVRQRIRAGRRF